MKNLVIYYSYSNNSKRLVKDLAKKFDFDSYEVKEIDKNETKNRIKFLHNAFKSIVNSEVEVENCNLDLTTYDTVVYVSAVWAGNLTAPMRSFINKYPLNKQRYAYCYLHEGGPGKYENKFENLMADNNLLGKIELKSVKKSYDQEFNKLAKWYQSIIK